MFFNDLFKLVLISRSYELITNIEVALLNTFLPGHPRHMSKVFRPHLQVTTALNSPYPLMKVKSIIAFCQKISQAGGMAMVPFPFERAPAFSGVQPLPPSYTVGFHIYSPRDPPASK